MATVDFAAFVEKLADVAADTILPFFRTALRAEDKNTGGMFDPVTEADRAAEAAMRHLIQETFPDHGIIGEEFGSVQSEADYVWVLDPIDGTKSFIAGMPVWGSLIGLMHKGQPVYGMMVQPFTLERFTGDGKGALWRGPGSDRRMTQPKARLSRYGGDCYAFAMLAAGHVNCVIESGLNTYDIAPLVPIIEGAGGIVTCWDGGNPAKGGDVVASCDARTHDEVLSLLRG
jgi:fructose-1,6-bisphosphatase/inositol monophosphatase family enzyme